MKKLYEFLELGEPFAVGDEVCIAGLWRPVAAPGARAPDLHPYRRLVAEVPDDANIPAALIAAEIVDVLILGPYAPPRSPRMDALLAAYRAAKAGA